ncbi:MAG: hypothetical protein DWQ44_08910 [Bacteroidetes bacterium]|nr:MAG: hypothetical protein DWQ39_02700 [Bacteroidota bacterium]REK33175.1 MAG: hypothetical protein DWQ44_08910 [Bacteroidota bacterium]REK47011.1 MAG: hypothetical protein DWQ48_13240 [Bacteroidota bacterium]
MAGKNYIVNERPEGMSWEAYKKLRSLQGKALRKYKKGRLAFVSVEQHIERDASGKRVITRSQGKTYKKIK